MWKNDKVRDLLDSMLKGYPIGYVMLWEPPADDVSKKSQIGDNDKVYAVPKGARYRWAAAPHRPARGLLRRRGEGQLVRLAAHQNRL